MKKWFSLFVYISIIFLLYKLYQADYLIIPNFKNLTFLSLSIGCLFSGFLLDGVRWKFILEKSGFDISYKDGLISNGITVFGKYIPGKIWMLLAKAAYINKNYGFSVKTLSFVSFQSQLLALWTGALIGFLSLIHAKLAPLLFQSILLVFAILSLILFSEKLHHFVNVSIEKVLRKKIKIPFLPFKKVFSLIPIFAICWIAYALGFYFLGLSLGLPMPTFSGAIFPLSAVIGVAVLIAPGGLGIREGLIVGYFLLLGLQQQEATTLAICSRLWFLTGELFVFAVAFFLNNFKLS